MVQTAIKRIFVQKEKCNGCRICELRCSFEHETCFSPSLSRIHVFRNEKEGIAIPKICIICGKCIDSCPEGAISKSNKTGAIKIDKQKCTGCFACVEACPYGVMKMHPSLNIAMTCDLCDGDPQCVKYCPENVLHYMTAREFSEYKKTGDKRKRPSVIPE